MQAENKVCTLGLKSFWFPPLLCSGRQSGAVGQHRQDSAPVGGTRSTTCSLLVIIKRDVQTGSRLLKTLSREDADDAGSTDSEGSEHDERSGKKMSSKPSSAVAPSPKLKVVPWIALHYRSKCLFADDGRGQPS